MKLVHLLPTVFTVGVIGLILISAVVFCYDFTNNVVVLKLLNKVPNILVFSISKLQT